MPRGWVSMGTNGEVSWGEYLGSSPTPYHVVSDLQGVAGTCSCPSQRVPCKHVVALRQEQPAPGEVPDWVTAWLSRREPRSPQQPKPEAIAQQAVRGQRREERISAGVDDLERWLHDFVRAGLAEAAARPWASFEQMSARLVDAQAPGLARFVRELGSLPYATTNWPERMLVDLGQVWLLLEAWRQRDSPSFNPDLRADVRSLVGINEPREVVLTHALVHDTWDALGRRLMVGERMLVQRTWLFGRQTRRWALLLDFAVGGQRIEQHWTAGHSFAGDLCFFSGATPLRALPKEPLTRVGLVESLPTEPLSTMLTTWAAWLGRNPWLERMPAVIGGVVPIRGRDDAWWVQAEHGKVPIAGPLGWHLAAISGGAPIELCGEWDGFAFWPLAARAEGRVVPLRAPEAA